MPIRPETITVRSISVDPGYSDKCLTIGSREDFLEVMKDNRIISGFAAVWVEQLYGVRMNRKTHTTFAMPHPQLELRATVRCFSEGNIRFQQSSRKGVHREDLAHEGHLMVDAERVDYYFVCDARALPRLDFYPLRSAKILNFVHSRKLTLSGMTPAQFDDYIANNFVAVFQDIDADGRVIAKANGKTIAKRPKRATGPIIGQTPR